MCERHNASHTFNSIKLNLNTFTKLKKKVSSYNENTFFHNHYFPDRMYKKF